MIDTGLDQNSGMNVVMIVIVSVIAILVLIFVSILGGSVYSNVEPQIESISMVSDMVDDSFIASYNSGVVLDHDRLLGNVSFSLDK
jgi:arginine exporter protein ArgO